MRFTVEAEQRTAIIVIDGGYSETGEALAEHIKQHYRTAHVDLMISTHPDQDHIGGLATAMELLDVDELLIHEPRKHVSRVHNFSNIEAVDKLIALARDRRVRLTEPFAGLCRFGDQLRVLGPTQIYYEQMVRQHLDEVVSGEAAMRARPPSQLLGKGAALLERLTAMMPMETLTDDDGTGPRNETSVVTLLEVDGHRLLFTGDAGILALDHAADEYEAIIGPFMARPLSFFQVPHHGSRRNLGPTILNRMLGPKHAGYGTPSAFVSSAAADPKHPSPKVVNAVTRRGGEVCATEGRTICHYHDAPIRAGWSTLTPYGPLDEDDE